MIDEMVECDWLARFSDVWDAHLVRSIQHRHASLQALRDAIDVRNLIFDLMPHVESVSLRVFREASHYKREMIVTGSSQRNDHTSRDLHTLVMRAKVLGFRFDLEGDQLRALPLREPAAAYSSRLEDRGWVRRDQDSTSEPLAKFRQ
jgi:hypothetical protein